MTDVQADLVLSKDALLASLGEARTDVVRGVRVRALSAADYQRLQAERIQAVQQAKAPDRELAYGLADLLGWLVGGVVEPKLTKAEWAHFAEQAGSAGVIGEIIERIKELSGARDVEVELAKKVSEELQDVSES